MMRTRLTLVAAACLSLLLSTPARTPQRTERSGFILFAVANEGGGTTIEPIALVSGGAYVFPESAGGVDEELQKFSAEYFREGRKYRVVSGGGDAGTLTVKRSHVADECFRAGADVELQSPVKVGRVVWALATDSETLARGKGERRPPTDTERAAATKLAESVMRARRVPAAALKTLGTINLTATDLDADGRAELIGTFVARTGQAARYVLFLLAEPQADGSYKAGVSEYQQIKAADLPEPDMITEVVDKGFLSEILVDQADLDGDRVGEVVSTSGSFEGQHYTVYKRAAGRWKKVYEGSNYRCAY